MWITTVIWYGVEFITMCSITAYVAFTFGLLKPLKFKNDTPATLDETWKGANKFISSAASIANRFQKALDPDEKKEEKKE